MTFFWEPGGVKTSGEGDCVVSTLEWLLLFLLKVEFCWNQMDSSSSYSLLPSNDFKWLKLDLINYYRHFTWCNTQNCFQKGCVLYISGVKSRNSGPKIPQEGSGRPGIWTWVQRLWRLVSFHDIIMKNMYVVDGKFLGSRVTIGMTQIRPSLGWSPWRAIWVDFWGTNKM